MRPKDLLAKIGKEDFPPVILFCPWSPPGKSDHSFEPFLAEEAISRIAEAYVEPGMHDLVYSVFYADEAKVEDILMEAQTLPFLAERKVIVVRNADRYMQMSADKKSPLGALVEYIKAPSSSTILMLVSSIQDKRKKFYTACKEADCLVECPQLSDSEMQAWVRNEARKREKTIESGAASELVRRVGRRLGDVNNALSLVAQYIGERAAIQEADVIAACADVAEESVWNLTDAIAESNPKKALGALYQLLDFGKAPDEIMGTINWLLESAYKASLPASARTMSSFVQKKVGPLVKRFGTKKLRDAFFLCTKTHFTLRTTGVDKNLALELLVIKLSSSSRSAEARSSALKRAASR